MNGRLPSTIVSVLMKRIYLDWGVISNLKKPEYDHLRQFLISHKGELFFVYSTAHFEDAMRSTGDERLMQDIRTLESIADDHLLAFNQDYVRPYLITPSEYYRDIRDKDIDTIPDFTELLSFIGQDMPIVGDALKSVLDLPCPIPVETGSHELLGNMFSDLPEAPLLKDVVNSVLEFTRKMVGNNDFYKSYRSGVRSTINLEANAGNWKAQEVVPNISAQLKKLGIDMSFDEFVRYGFGNRDNISNFQFFIAAYAILDIIGYKPDKLPKASVAMNSVNTDAKYAFFAAYCDYFITQDAHLTCKARALYHEFRISTKIISPLEVMTELKTDDDYDVASFFQKQFIEANEVSHDGAVAYKFTRRFLGVFSHCVVYKLKHSTLLEFKLAFNNYSRFVFYEEAGIMVDVVCNFLGRPSQEDFHIARKRIIEGDTDASITWNKDNVMFILKADEERHRPELFVEITDSVC